MLFLVFDKLLLRDLVLFLAESLLPLITLFLLVLGVPSPPSFDVDFWAEWKMLTLFLELFRDFYDFNDLFDFLERLDYFPELLNTFLDDFYNDLESFSCLIIYSG